MQKWSKNKYSTQNNQIQLYLPLCVCLSYCNDLMLTSTSLQRTYTMYKYTEKSDYIVCTNRSDCIQCKIKQTCWNRVPLWAIAIKWSHHLNCKTNFLPKTKPIFSSHIWIPKTSIHNDVRANLRPPRGPECCVVRFLCPWGMFWLLAGKFWESSLGISWASVCRFLVSSQHNDNLITTSSKHYHNHALLSVPMPVNHTHSAKNSSSVRLDTGDPRRLLHAHTLLKTASPLSAIDLS